MGNNITTILLRSKEGFESYKKLLAKDAGELELYHADFPKMYPCFAVSEIMEDGFSAPYWEHLFIYASTLNDPTMSQMIEEYMDQEDIHNLKFAACEAIVVAVDETRKASIAQAEWNDFWDHIDELKEKAKAADPVQHSEHWSPAPHAYPEKAAEKPPENKEVQEAKFREWEMRRGIYD